METVNLPGPEHRRWVDPVVALVVAAAVLVALAATGPDFGIVWDEGYTIARERLLDAWFTRVGKASERGGGSAAFSRPVLDRFWPFSREEPHGHPPFYALLGLAGWRLSRGWRPPLEAYRFGPMVLAAATAGVIYLHLARRRGRLAGLAAAASLLLMPRVFAHAHYAHYDMPMTCLWLLAQVAFVASIDSVRWAVPFGVALGLAAGTKFTGLFAVVPPVAWVALVGLRSQTRQLARPGLRTLAIGLPVAVLTLYAIQPPWWQEPVAGPVRFVVSNLSREETQALPVLYLGRYYRFALPWHNTLVLTAVTTPLVVLALGVIGIGARLARRRREPWGLIWPLSWATLMIVRALPHAPGHDGIRLFLPSVASLAVLAGLGLAWLAEGSRSRRAIALLVALAGVGECLAGIARTYPYTDSYYNAAIGGLKGAERYGFELTYYWETAGPEFLAWVRSEKRRRPLELVFNMDTTDAINHRLLRQWGALPPDVPIYDPERPEHPDYVQQRRRAFFYPWDWWLEEHGRPHFVIRREGVDLLRVYPFEQYVEAGRRTFGTPLPPHLRH